MVTIRDTLLAALFLTACTHQPVLSPVSATRLDSTLAKVAPDSVAGSNSWLSQIYRPGVVYYEYNAISTVELTESGSLQQVDSSRISAVLSVSFPEVTSQGLQHITTHAESLSVFNQLSLAVSTRPSEEHSTILSQRAGKMQVTHQNEICTQQSKEFIFRGDELTPILLQESISHSFWVDTTEFQICRGGIQLQVTRVARYQANTQDFNQSDLQITRLTTAQIRGQGFQWQQPVQATGQLTGVDTLVFGGSSHRLSSIHGGVQLELEFTSSHRVQHFRQSTNSSVIVRP